jgi:Tol biopolymer transport system component
MLIRMASVFCLILAMAACGDDGPTDVGTGAVEVTTVSTGEDMDPNGYLVHVQGAGSQAIGINATATLAEVTAGDLEVRLTGMQGNCTVQGNHPRIIRVVAGETFRMHFDVVCIHSPLLGRILFDSGRDGNRELYSMNPDGSDVVRLTTTPDDQESDGSSSPDGTRILFESTPGPYGSDVVDPAIYVMNADGSGRVNLSNGSYNDHAPVWSPDGSRIAFTSTYSRSEGTDIWVMNADGTGLVNLTNSPVPDEFVPTWSPDGSRILYAVADGSGSDLYTMNADGSNQTRLTDGPEFAGSATWSPDGNRIAFRSSPAEGEPKIFVMNADGSERVRLTDAPGEELFPTWSPDGQRLAFVNLGPLDSELYVINSDGTGLTNISNSPASMEFVGPQAWGP